MIRQKKKRLASHIATSKRQNKFPPGSLRREPCFCRMSVADSHQSAKPSFRIAGKSIQEQAGFVKVSFRSDRRFPALQSPCFFSWILLIRA